VNKQELTSVGRTYIHTCQPTSTRRTISRTAHLYGNVYMQVGVARALADFRLLEEQS